MPLRQWQSATYYRADVRRGQSPQLEIDLPPGGRRLFALVVPAPIVQLNALCGQDSSVRHFVCMYVHYCCVTVRLAPSVSTHPVWLAVPLRVCLSVGRTSPHRHLSRRRSRVPRPLCPSASDTTDGHVQTQADVPRTLTPAPVDTLTHSRVIHSWFPSWPAARVLVRRARCNPPAALLAPFRDPPSGLSPWKTRHTDRPFPRRVFSPPCRRRQRKGRRSPAPGLLADRNETPQGPTATPRRRAPRERPPTGRKRQGQVPRQACKRGQEPARVGRGQAARRRLCLHPAIPPAIRTPATSAAARSQEPAARPTARQRQLKFCVVARPRRLPPPAVGSPPD